MAGDTQPSTAAPAADKADKVEPTPAEALSAPASEPAPAQAVEAVPEVDDLAAAGGDGDADADADADEEPAAEHVPMASRLSLISWGDGSAPSVPAIDDSSSDGVGGSGTGDGGSVGGGGDRDDADSLYDSERASSILKSTTTSLRSSMYDYVEENGRTYHRYKEGKYPLPNDIQEQARLDLQHAIFLLMAHGKSYLSPIDKPKRVLDVATGTGIWAIEFAIEFPESQVIGTDLSPIQPEFIPPNCTFEVDDAEDEWSFDQPFDYIHGRALISCFRNPATVINSVYANLVPGGILELQDGNFPLKFASPPPPNCALKRWVDLITEGAELSGRPWTNVKHYPRFMKEAGFENVVERKFYWPVSPWPKGSYYKTLGAYVQQDLLNGMEGLSLKLLGLLGWSLEDIRAFVADVRRDLLDTSIHAYIEVSMTWGNKPKTASATAESTTEATEATTAETTAETATTEAAPKETKTTETKTTETKTTEAAPKETKATETTTETAETATAGVPDAPETA